MLTTLEMERITMDNPSLKLECLKLAYHVDKQAKQIVEDAKAYWKFVTSATDSP